MVSQLVVGVFLLCGTLFQPLQVAAFKPLFQGGSLTHREITELAILRKTAEVCRDIATAQGRDFTLPDFYSHSNWVELGSTAPFSTLIKPELPLNNTAGPSTPTCKSCTGSNCSDNILPEILLQKKLTSGYFSVISSTKPAGKCSHGGSADKTSSREPTGGINKDDIDSDHGFLHLRAAEMAINATVEVLQDIRLATGNQAFLRLVGLSQTSVLAFVIDTTSSMSDDIEEAKRVSFSIIDSRRGTPEEPTEYILVPFNDPEIQLYRDLAHVSGGQTIEVTKDTLSQATAVITDASTSALVTVLQVVRRPVIAENVSFVLDPSLSNVTVYITGESPVFTIYSPTGVSQSGSVSDGPLGSILTVGNLRRVKLYSGNQTGEWKISIVSTRSYSLKVTGRNATLFVSVTGGDSVTVTDVLLVEASGSAVVNGTIKSLGATDFLVNIDRIPEWAFVVQMKGVLNDLTRSLPSPFQRQSPTQQQGSRITITVQPSSTIEPGIPFIVNFTLVTNATGGSYTIRAWTDHGFIVSFPHFLDMGTGGSAQGSVTLTAPSDTESGTDVTLTIEAEDSETGDSNYMALRFIVMTKVTDFSSPVCQVVSIKADCPVECSRASWELCANLTDGNGSRAGSCGQGGKCGHMFCLCKEPFYNC
ncbi:von Willebrand factor A domain-containing 7-like protein [Labeo rohita]|uniref:von Willebrand factor A domain-containing 7-like protein n=1 Tax=Labeo rohita TaxID=84645 RepID=A0A498L7S7_LABRO|nr:von Willebrand factor A domain-containing 7-like protein [Labeo rohita]